MNSLYTTSRSFFIRYDSISQYKFFITMTTNDINNELLTLSQTQAYMKCGPGFIWKKRKEGLIKSVKAGKKVLIIKASIDKYLNLEQ